MPDVTGLSVDEARQSLDESGLESVLDGTGVRVIRQLPAAGARMNAGALVMLYVDGPAGGTEESVSVPDVTGMPVTEAFAKFGVL